MVIASLLLFVVISPISGYLISDRKHADTCTYTFQVWRPDDNVLDKIRHLESICVNITSGIDGRLAKLRNLVLDEILDSRNVTHHLETRLVEQRLRHVQQEVELKELRLALYDVRKETDKLWQAVGGLQGGRVAYHEGAPLAGSLDHVTGLIGQLKNSVGDLKAEWLLIKREVTDMKTENLQTKLIQNELKADIVRMKSLLDGIRSQTNLIRNQLDDVTVTQQSLKKEFSAPKRGFTVTDPESQLSRLRNDVIALRSRSERLEGHVIQLSAINDDIRREIQDVVGAQRNISADDVARLLQKMATLSTGYDDKKFDEDNLPKDCHDVYKQGYRVSGVYEIKPETATYLDTVYCEMINNTGWTVLMRRQDGTIRFTKGWLEYQHGFGSLYGEFWIGNEKIHQITKQKRYRLRVDLWDWEGGRSYAEYETFYVGSAESKYKLRARDYSGNAGDSLSYHDDMAFSTEDSDNDLHMSNCAETNKGGWWYNSCYSSNLNGLYRTGWYTKSKQTFADGIVWYTLKESEFYSLRKVEMKVIPLHVG